MFINLHPPHFLTFKSWIPLWWKEYLGKTQAAWVGLWHDLGCVVPQIGWAVLPTDESTCLS